MDKNNVYVYAIMINYCHPEITIDGVNSLLQSRNVKLKIIVVDNNSPDGSYEILKEKLPNSIILLKAEANLGFSAGNNIGIQYALEHNADYVMLINNDTTVEPDMISILLENTNDKTVTSPKMYYYDQPELIWFAGGKYYRNTARFKHIGLDQIDSNKFQRLYSCDFLTGCCFMMTGKIARMAGLLDENYFMYMEDVDYSIRLKNMGMNLIMVPDAKLKHKVSISSGGVEQN